jgi:hypothetical protein
MFWNSDVLDISSEFLNTLILIIANIPEDILYIRYKKKSIVDTA